MSERQPIRWDERASAAQNARAILPGLARKYFEDGRALLAKKRGARKMHRFRLKTKRFRYTLELFRDAYGPSFEKRLELLKPLQSTLGEINDCAATLELLDERLHGRYDDVKSFLEKRAKKKTAEFERYWGETFDAPGQSQAWVNYLGRPMLPVRPA